MNKDRRKAIAKAQASLEEIKGEIEMLRDEEQEYRDALPESMADGEKGEKADTAIAALEEAVSQIEEAIDQLTEAAE